jgi:2-polyprenyl-3-methyl-5-hydroxy-6-metoxy-1,4-benzoquinol methylase
MMMNNYRVLKEHLYHEIASLNINHIGEKLQKEIVEFNKINCLDVACVYCPLYKKFNKIRL